MVLNLCLFIATNFLILENTIFEVDMIGRSGFTIPYIDGGVSISRTARTYPTYLIFKPGMIITAFLLIKYWIANNNMARTINNQNEKNYRFLFFGVSSAIFLIAHSIFLGISFEYDLYKFFRRFILIAFIIFEIVAQALLVVTLFKIKNKIIYGLNKIEKEIIKKKFKSDIGIMCDVALDPYTSHGHDGLIKKGYVQNDETVEILVKQALLLAEMECDVIAPSDMMDGRIGKIRKALDKKNFQLVQILSYAVKYASNFYGPFRDAVGSKINLKGNKKNYQMNFFNQKEALREVAFDIKEGADFVMVKPGMPYLDVIKLVSDTFKIPVFAYQVSGEYSLIKNGIKKKIISENAIEESLISFKRAGASAIVTYFADYIAKKLR